MNECKFCGFVSDSCECQPAIPTPAAFISRHEPTSTQAWMALHQGFSLVHVGDVNAFDTSAVRLKAKGYAAACCVHPAAALALATMPKKEGEVSENLTVLLFENGSRPVEGGPPSFTPVKLHQFRLEGDWQGTGAVALH